MQNCKLEQSDQGSMQQSNAGQGAQTIQVMPTVLGTPGGQQILLQSLQSSIGAGGQQQIQVVPIQALGQGGAIIVQPQMQAQPQIVQLPDGQTFIYQPMIPETQAQPQIVNINGNFYQIPAQQAAPAQTAPTATTTIQNQQNTGTAQNQPTQQVVMMTSQNQANASQNDIAPSTSVAGLIASSSVSPPPSTSSPTPQAAESEEEPLYVNASKILCFYTFHFNN